MNEPRTGFDFTSHMRLVCEHISRTIPELGHVDMHRVAVSFAQTRVRSPWGMFASLTPLRFANGEATSIRRGRRYTIQRVRDRAGEEMLYILSFYLPRFLDQTFSEKLITIFHELWHISPAFNGDLRRHEGRCYAHSSSQKEYDAAMAVLSQRWLNEVRPAPDLIGFLRCDFRELHAREGAIYGARIARPKLLPLAG